MALIKSAVTLGSAVWLLAANTALEAPRIGFVCLANHEVWSLRGIAGSFYFGQRAASDVDRMAFNGQIGVRASRGHAELLGSSGEVLRDARIEGDIRMLGLATLEEAAFVLTGVELWRLTPSRAERFPAPEIPEGHRLAGIGGAGPYVDLALALDGQVSIHRRWLESGEDLVREAFAANPGNLLFLPGDALLWTEADVIVLRRPDASLAQIETGSPLVALRQSGQGWIHATAEDGRQFAVRLTGGGRRLDMDLRALPETAR